MLYFRKPLTVGRKRRKQPLLRTVVTILQYFIPDERAHLLVVRPDERAHLYIWIPFVIFPEDYSTCTTVLFITVLIVALKRDDIFRARNHSIIRVNQSSRCYKA